MMTRTHLALRVADTPKLSTIADCLDTRTAILAADHSDARLDTAQSNIGKGLV